jgi:hypothetical protein
MDDATEYRIVWPDFRLPPINLYVLTSAYWFYMPVDERKRVAENKDNLEERFK